ncbi:MAG TPA: hypothetical protein VGK67_00915 [Myxococcales bacterium]
MFDRARYPRLAQYLDTLPNALASFPEAQAKGSICKHLLEKHPIKDPQGLPDEIVAFTGKTIPSAAWVSEAACMGLHLAIGDTYQMGAAEYDRWLYEHNAGLLEGRFMFKALMSLASPAVLMQGAAIRFNGFHQGTRLELASSAAKGLDFHLAYPSGLYTELCLAAFRAAFQVSLDMTKARDVRCALVSAEPAKAQFRVTWAKWDDA